MDKLVKRIDPHFSYEWHEIEDDIMVREFSKEGGAMPLLWEHIKASTQHISKAIQGFAYSGNESGSCHQKPLILLPK